jgi:hypothetical protein
LADAEPEPLTLANLMTKSLTASILVMPPPPNRQLTIERSTVGGPSP